MYILIKNTCVYTRGNVFGQKQKTLKCNHMLKFNFIIQITASRINASMGKSKSKKSIDIER